MAEMVSGCGNTGPFGMHTERYAAVLVYAPEDGLAASATERLALAFTKPDTAAGAHKNYHILQVFKEASLSNFDSHGRWQQAQKAIPFKKQCFSK